MVTFEEWVVPVFTKASAADLGMVCSCVTVAGLGCTASQVLAAVEPGSIVAVVGCGPLGLSAIQGARIAGASRIIAIEPIRVRRDVALKVGATDALDPNVEGNKLVDKVRELSNGPNNRLWAGGRDSGGLLGGAGADFVVEAVGADRAKPKFEAGPDPTGILPIQQAYMMCAPGGHIVTTSLPTGNITLPAVVFTIGGRTHHAGQYGGANPMRDIPRFVELLDRGQFDAKVFGYHGGPDRGHAGRLPASHRAQHRNRDHDRVTFRKLTEVFPHGNRCNQKLFKLKYCGVIVGRLKENYGRCSRTRSTSKNVEKPRKDWHCRLRGGSRCRSHLHHHQPCSRFVGGARHIRLPVHPAGRRAVWSPSALSS